VQLIFDMLGGIGTDTEDLMHMKRTADRLLGGQYLFSILAAGRRPRCRCWHASAKR
jgi:3,5-dioxohexanoate:acetyl-CoA acetone transferase